jgi:predicted transcriptional regulator
MQSAKAALEKVIHDLPDILDLDEVMHQLYLLQKIEAGEQDVRNGKVLSHEKAELIWTEKFDSTERM